MSWTHSSKAIAVGVLLAIAVGMVGTAAAASVSVTEQPDVKNTGDDVQMEVVVEDPHPPSEWTLSGETELENAQWSIQARNIDDEVIEYSNSAPEGSSFEQTVSSSDSTDEITISVSGQVPELSNDDLSYSNIDSENYTAMQLEQDGSLIEGGEVTVHRFKADTQHKQARETLDRVTEDVDPESSETLSRGISLYEAGDFEQAISTAEDVESDAESEQQTQQLLLIGGAVVVLIAVLGGGYYVYSQRKQNTNKLQ